MSWNVHGCIGTDGRLDPDRVATVLGDLEADVIGLQEVDGRHPSVDGLDQLPYLARCLGLQAIAGPNLREDTGDYGNALLTRFEVRQRERLDLSLPGFEPRGAIDAKLACEGQPLRVVVTHLGLDRQERAAQLSRLHDHLGLAAEALPTVLLGDFNEWVPRRLERHALTRGHAFWTRLRTFPSRLPLLPLDRVLVHPDPSRVDARTLRHSLARRASDHLAIVVDLAW